MDNNEYIKNCNLECKTKNLETEYLSVNKVNIAEIYLAIKYYIKFSFIAFTILNTQQISNDHQTRYQPFSL